MSASIIITLVIIAALIWSAWKGMPLPLPFRNRVCQGAGWRRAFPDVPKQNIREFHALFAEAFAFKDGAKLQFNPNDKILDVYRSLYPHKWQPDALEVETLATLIEKHIVSALALYGAINLLLGSCSLMQAGWEECNAQPIIQAGLPNGSPLIQTLDLQWLIA
jgi:propanediol dehydratase small subunit